MEMTCRMTLQLTMKGSLIGQRLQNAPGSRAQSRPGGKFVVRASGNTFGHLFRVTTFGESHGKGVGCVIDGVPPRMKLTEADIQAELNR